MEHKLEVRTDGDTKRVVRIETKVIETVVNVGEMNARLKELKRRRESAAQEIKDIDAEISGLEPQVAEIEKLLG